MWEAPVATWFNCKRMQYKFRSYCIVCEFVCRIICLLFAGRSHGVSHPPATSRYSVAAVGHDEKLASDWDWDREREKHQRTLNGTRFTSAGTLSQEPATQNWPCVDNTSCEIQLSLVEQQQKLLSQKRQAAEWLQTSSHAGLRNGHSDVRMNSVLSSLDNRHLDDKLLRSNTSIPSKSQREFVHGTELYRGVGSRHGCSGSVGDFNPNLAVNNYTLANGEAHKPPAEVPAAPAMVDKKHVREHVFNATDEQTKKKLRCLQHLHGSEKSGTGTTLYIDVFHFNILLRHRIGFVLDVAWLSVCHFLNRICPYYSFRT